VSAQTALQEDAAGQDLRETPQALLGRPQASPARRWASYGAAAAVVLGVGLGALWYSIQPAEYRTQETLIQLAAFNTALKKEGVGWKDALLPGSLGFVPAAPSSVIDNLAPLTQAGIQLGAKLVHIKLLAAYQRDAVEAQIQLIHLKEILAQFNPDSGLEQEIKALAEGSPEDLTTLQTSHRLNLLYGEIDAHIKNTMSASRLYFQLGGWLYNVKIGAAVIRNTSVALDTAGQADQARRFAKAVQKAGGHQGLVGRLERLAELLEAGDGPAGVSGQVQQILDGVGYR